MRELLKDQDEWLNELEAMKQRSHHYMVLDTRDIKKEDLRRLELYINILSVCHTLAIANAMLRNLGVSKEFDFSIMLETMNAVLNAKSLTDERLEKYHQFIKEYSRIKNGLELIDMNVGDICIDSDIDLLMIGFNLEEVEKIYNWSSEKIGIEHYFDIQEEYKDGKISFNKFITETKQILTAILANPLNKH